MRDHLYKVYALTHSRAIDVAWSVGVSMSCGNNDLLCYLIGLLAQHGIEITAVLKLWPWIEESVLANLQAIVGLAGFSFGLWKWWYFRERVLHKRLKEYLQHQDERLLHARSYVLEALYKPGAARNFAEPLFAVRPLRRVLRRRGWNSLLSTTKLETGADRLLNKALRHLDSRLDAAEKQIGALRQQQASAHFLKGAIASARVDANRWGASSTKFDYRALDAFRAALQVPGHDADAELVEYEAHQLRKLGYLDDADRHYASLEGRAPSITGPQERDLFLARVKRWRGVIAQAQGVENYLSGLQTTKGSLNAYNLIHGADGAMSSLNLRSRYAPFQDWSALEQADIHYLAAYICHNCDFRGLEPDQLGLADTEYRRILDQASKSRWLQGSNGRRLRKAAEAGLLRVQQARTQKAYDERWLLPPSQPLERPTSEISGSSSQQAVSETAKKHNVEVANQS